VPIARSSTGRRWCHSSTRVGWTSSPPGSAITSTTHSGGFFSINFGCADENVAHQFGIARFVVPRRNHAPVIAASWTPQILPTAVVVAVSPASYLAALTLLTTERPLTNAWAFAAGWFTAVVGIFVVTYAFTSPAPPQTASSANSIVSAVLGIAAIVAAVVIWRKQSASSGEAKQPKWLARMENIKPVAAYGLGFFLPTYGLIPPAAVHLKDLHLSSATAVIAAITFGLVATSGVIIPNVAYSASHSLRARLRRLRDVAVANQMKIAAALLGVIGLSLLASAITTALSLHKMS